MNHNSYPSNYEDEDDNQVDDSYSQWQEAMQDVEFQGNLTSASTNQETIPISSTPEIREAPTSKVEKLLQKIQDTKEYVKTMLGISSEEKLTEMTDDALVYVAKETIATADEDGTRTEAESAKIEEAVSSVVVQGAMEEAGIERSTGDNPILELNQDNTQSDLASSIEMLREEDAVLPGGQNIAELATRTIEHNTEEPYETIEPKPRLSVSETIRILSSQEMERSSETIVRPKTEIICDHSHIEGQRIDVINKEDKGSMEFSFKLRAPTEPIIEMTAKLAEDGNQTEVNTPSGAVLKRGQIMYEGSYSDNSYELCDAFVFEKEGVKVAIADPTSRNGEEWSISDIHNDSKLIRTAMGLVKVEAPLDMKPEMTEQILREILEKDLGIPDALGEVPEEAEKEYKMARYKWQHTIDGDLSPEQIEQAERLDREEVFPGYTTLVEHGKHKEYLEKYGEDMRAIHSLSTGNARSIYRILTQGLMCTTERYSRGIVRNGMSSTTDMDTGGADSVFTRIMNADQRSKQYGAMVIFKPEVFDRTDWYTYDSDTYGSTDEESFSGRLSPDEIFEKTSSSGFWYPSGNEQMFRTGIGANYVESIEVNADARDEVIAELKSMGLEEIDGKPIEEIVVSRQIPEPKAERPDFGYSFDEKDELPDIKQPTEGKGLFADLKAAAGIKPESNWMDGFDWDSPIPKPEPTPMFNTPKDNSWPDWTDDFDWGTPTPDPEPTPTPPPPDLDPFPEPTPEPAPDSTQNLEPNDNWTIEDWINYTNQPIKTE